MASRAASGSSAPGSSRSLTIGCSTSGDGRGGDPSRKCRELPPEETGSDDAEESALQRLSTQRVRQVLEKLTPEQREVLLLRVFGDLTVDEVARLLGKSSGAIKALQRRGLKGVLLAPAKDGVTPERFDAYQDDMERIAEPEPAGNRSPPRRQLGLRRRRPWGARDLPQEMRVLLDLAPARRTPRTSRNGRGGSNRGGGNRATRAEASPSPSESVRDTRDSDCGGNQCEPDFSYHSRTLAAHGLRRRGLRGCAARPVQERLPTSPATSESTCPAATSMTARSATSMTARWATLTTARWATSMTARWAT